MKKILTLLLCLFVIIAACDIACAESEVKSTLSPPYEAVSIANQKMSSVISDFESSPQKWGYSNKEEVDSLVLGECYRVYYIGENAEYASGDSLDELIDFTAKEVWLFTLESNEVPMGEIRVSYRNGKYYIMGYSGYDRSFVDAYSYATRVAYSKGLNISNKLISVGPNYYFVLEGNKSLLVPVVYSGSNFSTDVETLTNVVKTSVAEYHNSIQSNLEPAYGGANLTEKLRKATESTSNLDIKYYIIPLSVVIALGVTAVVFAIDATKKKCKKR